jgi:AcrR family transcriptional regulator
MATQASEARTRRTPLSRDRVLRTAVALADEHGVDAVSMRKLAHQLGVDPMSLYNHVANKEDLLGGMVDLVVDEIELVAVSGADWKSALRSQVLETRTDSSPTIMRYFDAVAGIFREGGVSIDLMHHALHTIGSRVLGFTQELFDDSNAFDQGPEVVALMAHQMAGEFPNISAMMLQISHDESTVVGSGCDDQFEFEFALDLILDGIERRHNVAP